MRHLMIIKPVSQKEMTRSLLMTLLAWIHVILILCLVKYPQELPPVQYNSVGFLCRQQCEETQTQEGESRGEQTERSHRNCFLRRLCPNIMIAPTFIPIITLRVVFENYGSELSKI